jgi:hypothetical protein
LSAVSVVSEMIPTFLAMASAVTGWSPVTIITLIPAERHLEERKKLFMFKKGYIRMAFEDTTIGTLHDMVLE